MKKIITILLGITFTIAAFSQVPGVLKTGSSIPMADIKMKATNGKEVSIKSQMKKNGVLVIFSCNTCPYVVKYQSRTNETLKEAAKRDIGVIIINSNEEYRNDADSYEAMKLYAKAQGYNVPYVVDTKSAVADAFGATRTPECFLFDASGMLIYHGAIDDNATAANVTRKHLSIALGEYSQGKEVSVKEAKSIGCMIKRLD